MSVASVIAERRFAILFGSILLDWLAYPFLEGARVAKAALGCFSLAVLLSALYTTVIREQWRSLAIGLGVPAVTVVATQMVLEAPFLALARDVLLAAFLFFVTATVLRTVLLAEEVTSEVVAGALCVYLLFGFVLAIAYAMLEADQPGSFAMTARPSGDLELRRSLLYFSYVTQTTVGYGDVVPVTPAARSLATVQAIAGQLYLAVLVARLVALRIVHQERT